MLSKLRNVLKASEFRTEIGYANIEYNKNDAKIETIFNKFNAINIIRDLMQRWRMKSIADSDPGEIIAELNSVVKMIGYGEIHEQSPSRLLETIINLSRQKYVKVMVPYNFLLQDIVNILVTGQYINLDKYSYVLERHAVIKSLDHKSYQSSLEYITIPKHQETIVSYSDLHKLLNVLGIEKTVYLFGLLINFGYYDYNAD